MGWGKQIRQPAPGQTLPCSEGRESKVELRAEKAGEERQGEGRKKAGRKQGEGRERAGRAVCLCPCPQSAAGCVSPGS